MIDKLKCEIWLEHLHDLVHEAMDKTTIGDVSGELLQDLFLNLFFLFRYCT